MGGGGIWAKYVNDFKARVIADGGTMESPSCAKSDVKFLVQNPEPVAFTGLLNDYSGAAAAYSLRLLDNTYTGNAIKVRRASDNAEQDIAFSNNELDTATLETFASGTDAFVTTWYDQSGNGNDAAQATASAQPQIVSSGSTILKNGNPSMFYDGSDDVLQSPFTSSQPISIAAVGNIDTARTFDYFISLNATFVLGSDGTPDWRLIAGNSLTHLPVTSSQTLLFSVANSTSSVLSVNGNSITGDAGTDGANLISIGARTIGGGELLGTISEIVIYNSNQTSNRTGIETNINDFYSIY